MEVEAAAAAGPAAPVSGPRGAVADTVRPAYPGRSGAVITEAAITAAVSRPHRPYYYGYPYYGPYYGPSFGFSFSYGYPGFYGSYGYGYPYYGYPSYGPYYPGYVAVAPGRPYGAVRLDLPERDAQVFVDGAYAGVVDNFDGRTQSRASSPARIRFELRLDGFQSTSFNVSVAPGGTVTYRTPLRPAP